MKLKDAVRETVQGTAGLFNLHRLRVLIPILLMAVLAVSFVLSGIASVVGTIMWIIVPAEGLRADMHYVLAASWVSFATLGFMCRVAEKCKWC